MMKGKRFRRYHVHPPALLYFAVTAFLVVGAVNSQNNLLFIALGIAVGAIVVSGFISGSMMMGVEVDRVSVPDARVGEAAVVRYVVRNRSALFPAFALHVEELPPRGRAPRKTSKVHAFVGHVGPGGAAEVETVTWPGARGPIPLRAVRVWTVFPFGIVRKSVTFVLPAEGLARPMVLPVRHSVLTRVRETARRGVVNVSRVGAGDEYYGLRPYAEGDPLRRIAWKQSARTGDLLVTQRAAEIPQRVQVELRDDPSWEPRERERAIVLAASMIEGLARQGFAVGLRAGGMSIAPGQGTWHVRRLQARLARLGFDEARDEQETGPAETRVVIGGQPSGDLHIDVADFERVLDVTALRPGAPDRERGGALA